MTNLMERTRPKGYNKKAWEYFYKEAEAQKEWALSTLKTNPNWVNEASDMSIKMLGSYLYLKTYQIATESYDYIQMRAHGQTFLGALDRGARETWETITGKRVLVKNTWKYDHRNYITSARKDKKWVNSKGEVV